MARKTKKQEKSNEMIYEEIKEKFYSDEEVVISRVVIPENIYQDYFAVIHQYGVTIYDDSEEHGIVEFGSIDWNEFPDMKVRFFKFTTDLMFYADDRRFRKLTLHDDRREVIIDYVKRETPVNLEVIQLKWYNNIPGFRSGTRWKMIMSSIVYLWILGFLYNMIIN